MASNLEPLVSDSNWIFCYVVIGLIPLVFICVATYSVWRDRRTNITYDVEALKARSAKKFPPFQDQNGPVQPFSRTPRPNFYIPTLPVNRVGPCTPAGFPIPAASRVPDYSGSLREKRPL